MISSGLPILTGFQSFSFPPDFKHGTVTQEPLYQFVNNIVDIKAIFSFQGTFPYMALPPAGIFKKHPDLIIPFAVAIDFIAPPFLTCGRPFEQMAVMPMPETAMCKNHSLVF